MDSSKRKQAILYIEANRLFFYPGIAGEILQLPLPQDSISNLEILNPQKLSDTISLFFQSQKILPSEMLFIFSPAIVFEKEFPLGEKEEVIQAFLDYVPFDDILSRTFTLNKKLHVFAISKNLYNFFKLTTEKLQCVCAGVIAYSSLFEVNPELSQKVDLTLILARFEAFKQFNLDLSSHQEEPVGLNNTSQKTSNKRIFVLIGIFGALLLVLVIMIFMTMSSSSLSSKTIPQTLPVSLPTPTIPVATTSGNIQQKIPTTLNQTQQ